MIEITPEGRMTAILFHLQLKGPTSSGNITRALMGKGQLPKETASYTLVADALKAMLALKHVTKAGNGKAVHWRAVVKK